MYLSLISKGLSLIVNLVPIQIHQQVHKVQKVKKVQQVLKVVKEL